MVGGQTDVDSLINLFPEADVIIVEGLKDSDIPKVEVVRNGVSDEPVSKDPLLIATDNPTILSKPSAVDLNNAAEIYRRLTKWD